jgi:hypothetical protein
VEEIITDKKNTNQETMKLEKMVVEEIWNQYKENIAWVDQMNIHEDH